MEHAAMMKPYKLASLALIKAGLKNKARRGKLKEKNV